MAVISVCNRKRDVLWCLCSSAALSSTARGRSRLCSWCGASTKQHGGCRELSGRRFPSVGPVAATPCIFSFLCGAKTHILGRIQSSCPPGLGPAWRKLDMPPRAHRRAPARWDPIACSQSQPQAQLSSQGRTVLRARSHGWEILLACLHVSPTAGCTATDFGRSYSLSGGCGGLGWGYRQLKDNFSNQSSDLQVFVQTEESTRYQTPRSTVGWTGRPPRNLSRWEM